jgi:DNA invertase Pin-like site-specific DNA recombinase
LANTPTRSRTRNVSFEARDDVRFTIGVEVETMGIEPIADGLQDRLAPLEHASPQGKVRPGLEPGLPPYQRGVLPQHLQTVNDPGWTRTIISQFGLTSDLCGDITPARKEVVMSRANYLWCYGRVSSDKQKKGDGRRRQEDRDWDEFAAAHGFKVHPTFLYDDGISAWTADNWREDAMLGQFVIRAEAKREVRPGDCLGCECWDRLSKADDKTTLNNVLRILNAGVHLADIKRRRLIRADSFTAFDVLDLLMVTSRGNEGSSTTSDRCLAKIEQRVVGQFGAERRDFFLTCPVEEKRIRFAGPGQRRRDDCTSAFAHTVPALLQSRAEAACPHRHRPSTEPVLPAQAPQEPVDV